MDENNIPRHAHKRGIYTKGKSFKGNVDGCNPAYSFHHIGTSDRLYVFEAPIDMLSLISLYPKDWHQHSFVSLCGVGGQAMFKMLELYFEVFASRRKASMKLHSNKQISIRNQKGCILIYN